MNGFHKGHNIIISAARTGKLRQWKTHVKVIWSDDGLGKLARWSSTACSEKGQKRNAVVL